MKVPTAKARRSTIPCTEANEMMSIYKSGTLGRHRMQRQETLMNTLGLKYSNKKSQKLPFCAECNGNFGCNYTDNYTSQPSSRKLLFTKDRDKYRKLQPIKIHSCGIKS